MIKSITVTNHMNESLKMELFHPRKSGLLVCNVNGLGPPQANINTTSIASMDGVLFNSARASSRNIELTLGFFWVPLIEDARHLTYKHFPLKRKIKITVETDRRTCYTYGYVESNEPNIFSNLEGCKISIVCPNPYFYEEGDMTTITFTGVESEFEFPFSNESTSEKLLEISSIRSDLFKSFEYEGDSEIGVVLTIFMTGNATDITIYHTESGKVMKINTDVLSRIIGPLNNRDKIIISTVVGEKYIRVFRDGIYYNAINSLDKNSDWITIDKGTNTIGFVANTGSENIQLMVQYRNQFEGV